MYFFLYGNFKDGDSMAITRCGDPLPASSFVFQLCNSAHINYVYIRIVWKHTTSSVASILTVH